MHSRVDNYIHANIHVTNGPPEDNEYTHLSLGIPTVKHFLIWNGQMLMVMWRVYML